MTRFKICGISDPTGFDAVVAARADWVGLNFFPASPRFVTPSQAAMLSTRHDGGPARVGLFVDPQDDAIADTLATVKLDALQIYAAPARVAAIRTRFAMPVWRAVGVSSVADLPRNMGGADALLIEPRAPPDATHPGGNAVAMDWDILRDWTPPGPWLLAGGLTPANVADAIAVTGAWVDVSSGVEATKGAKDPALIAAFAEAVRGAFRRATVADAGELGAMHVQAWRETYGGMAPPELLAGLDPSVRAERWTRIIGEGGVVWLLHDAQGIAGFGSCGPQRHDSLSQSGLIGSIYLLRRVQRHGHGRRLMRRLALSLADQGFVDASLFVQPENHMARRFYEALGGQLGPTDTMHTEGWGREIQAYVWDDLTPLLG